MNQNLPTNFNWIISGLRIIMHKNSILCCDKPFCDMSRLSFLAEHLRKLKEVKIENFGCTVLYVDIEYLHFRKLDYGVVEIMDYSLWNHTLSIK